MIHVRFNCRPRLKCKNFGIFFDVSRAVDYVMPTQISFAHTHTHNNKNTLTMVGFVVQITFSQTQLTGNNPYHLVFVFGIDMTGWKFPNVQKKFQYTQTRLVSRKKNGKINANWDCWSYWYRAQVTIWIDGFFAERFVLFPFFRLARSHNAKNKHRAKITSMPSVAF